MHVDDLKGKEAEKFWETVAALRVELNCLESEAVYWVADDWELECDECKPLSTWEYMMAGPAAREDEESVEDDYSENSFP